MKATRLSLILLIPIVLVSCLKSKDSLGVINDNGSIVSEIYDAEYYGGVKVLSLDAAPPSEEIALVELQLFASRDLKPSADIQATLVQVPALVTGNGLTALPANALALPSLTVAIPKETGKVTLKATINKNALDLSKVYGIALKMTAVSEGVINELSKEVLIAIIVKNAYAADYDVTGFFFHPSAPREIHQTKSISTLGPARCRGQVGDLAGWNFDFDVNGAVVNNWTSSGATPTSPSAGFMTLDNPGGTDYSASAPYSPGTAPYTVANYGNSYNSGTKTFNLHYGYAGGSTGQNGYTRQIYESWVRE